MATRLVTKKEELRKVYRNEHVVNFFYFVAEEVRSQRDQAIVSLAEVIGRADLLKVRETMY